MKLYRILDFTLPVKYNYYMARFLLLLLSLILIAIPVTAQEKDINLLFLSSYAAELPWSAKVQEGIEKMVSQHESPVVIYNEYLDDMRLTDSLSEEEWAWYLEKKYRNANIDAILIDADQATGFFQNITQHFPGVPKIMNNNAGIIEPGDNLFLLESSLIKSAEETFKLALQQNPGTRHIYIVDGNVPTTRPIFESIEAYSKEIDIEPQIYQDFNSEDLFREISELPDNSVIFYTLVRNDSNGHKFIPREFLTSLCSSSNAPVYVFWSSLMNSGAIGGSLVDAEALGRSLCRSALGVIENGNPPPDNSSLVKMFDIKAVKRHSISIRDIPRNAVLINTFSSFLQNNSRIIFIIMIIISFFLAILIVLILYLHTLNRKLNVIINEKQLLMQEMNHRIKNDLLILSGLCSLQVMNETNPEVINRLNDINLRIDVLGLLHETLSEFPEISEITGSGYFKKLLEQLDCSVNPDKERIRMKVEITDISLTSKQIISCGLILNELVSNIFKHAFPKDRKGEIFIKIYPENKSAVLSVSDTGVGIKDNFNIKNSDSLGMRIINEMVIGLHGTIDYSIKNGTSSVIKFPVTGRLN